MPWPSPASNRCPASLPKRYESPYETAARMKVEIECIAAAERDVFHLDRGRWESDGKAKHRP